MLEGELNQGELADKLDVKQSSVHRWMNGAEPRGDRRDALLELYKTLSGDGPVNEIQLAGKVGAGSEINLLNNDDLGMVEAPPNADHNSIAVEVTGDSMFPAYEDGELLYYSSNGSPENLVNRRCVVKLGDGRIFVKTLRPGSTPALWNLESLNTQFPTMTDQTVEWVAKIDWVKPR